MIGERIKTARQASAFSLQDLADILEEYDYKITRAALSKFESEQLIPNETCMEVIARALGLSKTFFRLESWPDFGIEFFHDVDLIPKSYSELYAFLKVQLERHLRIDQLLGIDTPAFTPSHVISDDHDYISQVEGLVDWLRPEFGNASLALASVCEMLEDNGWYVFELPPLFGVTHISGIETSTGRPFLAFAYRESLDDTRFRILRELGYAYIQHSDPEVRKEICSTFARAMLFPRKCVEREFSYKKNPPNYSTVSLLKRKYGIARIQLRMRLRELGMFYPQVKDKTKYIERTEARKLYESRTEDLKFFEIPATFQSKVIEALNQGLIDIESAASMLPRRFALDDR